MGLLLSSLRVSISLTTHPMLEEDLELTFFSLILVFLLVDSRTGLDLRRMDEARAWGLRECESTTLSSTYFKAACHHVIRE